MHTRTLKKLLLTLTLWLALYGYSLRAQIFTAPLQASTTGTNPVDFEFRADGTLIAKGNWGLGSLLSTDQGPGSRMLWFPGANVFRVGSVDGSQWDWANIHTNSVAFGFDTIASGNLSTAFSNGTTASGNYSTAWGLDNTANGTGATATGVYTTASGDWSTSFGLGSSATAESSIAGGHGSLASGVRSFAFGDGAFALADFSAAFNRATTAAAFESFVVGRCNLGLSESGAAASPTTWASTDPVFEVGNGPEGGPNSDALVVYKDGNAELQGTLKVAPGGDIPMYTGN